MTLFLILRSIHPSPRSGEREGKSKIFLTSLLVSSGSLYNNWYEVWHGSMGQGRGR